MSLAFKLQRITQVHAGECKYTSAFWIRRQRGCDRHEAPVGGRCPLMCTRWQFWIDRGGTFTDCLGLDPETGTLTATKVLSSDAAPLVAIRQLLGLAATSPIPPCDVRMGTTVATNALLERKGTHCALITNSGLEDVVEIGSQARSRLFDLDITKPPLLHGRVLGVTARCDPDGNVIAPLDEHQVSTALGQWRTEGIDNLAIALLHSYRNPTLEQHIAQIASQHGFRHIWLSSDVDPEIGFLGRTDTTIVESYLTPLIQQYLFTLEAELPSSSLRIMQSSGGLVQAASFTGRNAILSGPAGGVVAYASIGKRLGIERAIGFDMGGTSTDVSCVDGDFERIHEAEIAGVRLRAPMMSIHTVAAGGGSICRDNGFRLTVGPESAGARPGPVCYGYEGATELTVTDVNLLLGRVADDRFPFSLHPKAARLALDSIVEQLRARGQTLDALQVAAGFADIANANMAQAIREVSVAKGRDVRDYALFVFGGAGGQHACPVARSLGIRTIVFDRFAGVLSAYGMGLANVSWHGQADGSRNDIDAIQLLEPRFAKLVATGKAHLADEGFADHQLTITREVDLRYRGTDAAITLPTHSDPAALATSFEQAHQRMFGYLRNQAIEITNIRVRVEGLSPPPTFTSTARSAHTAPEPRRHQRMWSGGAMRNVGVYWREDLASHQPLRGPALILGETGTIALDEGFDASVGDTGELIIRDRQPVVSHTPVENTQADPIRIEIFNNLFMSIASQMGAALQRTAVSTNIRDRLDFSCALFDATGALIANAPHIPVHLGAMSESIRGLLTENPQPTPGTVFATNDPSLGGSHLPDITVITPVHNEHGELVFFTANRGHHADIGGIVPGSMPAFSTALREEGALLRNVPIVCNDQLQEQVIFDALANTPHPARNPRDNLADLEAQVAANKAGADLLRELMTRTGEATVRAYMAHVQDAAASEVAHELSKLADGTYRFGDALDDGTQIQVTIVIAGDRMTIDFEGTNGPVEGNLNAPRAITIAAVIYVVRSLVGAPIPLNAGCLRNVDVCIPHNCLLSPPPGCAVAGGNVETSQRVVDVLLGALSKAAASQGTMNNLSFGTAEFGYYETIAGGAGATPTAPGGSAVHTHMTNTRITDPEVLESRFPVRLREFSIRRGSGGSGRNRGGDGVVREIETLEAMRVSILSERRTRSPFGLQGGQPGQPGRNLHNGRELPGKATFQAKAGDVVRIETPGGGGFGNNSE